VYPIAQQIINCCAWCAGWYTYPQPK